jgi:hypothetical protein
VLWRRLSLLANDEHLRWLHGRTPDGFGSDAVAADAGHRKAYTTE